MEVARRRVEMRTNFMNKLYEMVDGRTDTQVPSEQVGTAVGLTEIDLIDVLTYLEREHLIAGSFGLSRIWLLHDGKKEVEEASVGGESEHLLTAVQIGSITESNVQIAGSRSAQQMGGEVDLTKLALWVNQARESIAALELPPPRASEFESDIEAIESQLKSPRPKQQIVVEAVRSLRASPEM